MKTAVEWLEKQLDIDLVDNGWYFEKAKEMEKNQIIKAVFASMGTNLDPNLGRAEQYYNETYKNK